MVLFMSFKGLLRFKITVEAVGVGLLVIVGFPGVSGASGDLVMRGDTLNTSDSSVCEIG